MTAESQTTVENSFTTNANNDSSDTIVPFVSNTSTHNTDKFRNDGETISSEKSNTTCAKNTSLASLPTLREDGNMDNEIDDDSPDEEEEFLCNIEEEEEKEIQEESNNELKDDTTAPRLLQTEEEKKDDSATTADSRANQLDFLLSKATEYSNFIAGDLEELQNSMGLKAEEVLNQKNKSSSKTNRKKRKGSNSSSNNKKSKGNNGEMNLQKAQQKHKDQKQLVGSCRPIFIQPTNLAPGCVLKDYQLEGVRWLTSLFENGVSGILADEMGLGKTIQVIAMIAHLRIMGVPGPFLVVAPLATLPNWTREFEKWLPDVPVCRYHGTTVEREAMLNTTLHPRLKRVAGQTFPVIVTSYEMSIKDERKLNKIGPFTYLVVDEGQRLKNHRCTLIRSLKRIQASNRLLLSGTPIQNNLDELWSLLNFVNPVIFDDLTVFQSWFGFRNIGQTRKNKRGMDGTKEESILLEQRKNQTVSKLHEILRPFLLRRIKKDVLTDMPPKKELVVYAGMSKLQSGYADLIEKGVLRNVLISQGIEQGKSLSQTNKQMNHRKNANHPFLFGEPIDSNTGVHLGSAHPQLLVRASGKFALLDRMLDRLHKDGHQVLIFSQMTALLNVIEDYLLWRCWKYCRIDGSTKIDDRQKQMDEFNAEMTAGLNGSRNLSDDRHFVFLLSTRAGGLGINLASADTCIIFDSDWNPHQDSQAQDRCHRIGQTRPVAVYRLLTVNSVDMEMMEKQISKNKLARMAISGGDFRKAGKRSRGAFSVKNLNSLLEDDIKDFSGRGGDIESHKIDDNEFDVIMNRERLFQEGKDSVPTEGKMYDIIDANKGELLGAVNA